MAGALAGALCPRHVWAVPVGIVVGQLLYMLVYLPSGPMLPLGLMFLVGFALLSLLGAVLASQIRRRLGPDSSGGGHDG